jgi:hypothetical protein
MKPLIPSVLAACLLASVTHVLAVDTTRASQQIDAILAKDWQTAKVQPNKLASDEVFLRRVYLDVIGRIPNYDETLAFLSSTDRNKRARLIDQLLASEGYVHRFFNYWADVLRAQSTGVANNLASEAYLNFIRESLRSNKPFDQFARELVSTEGDCFKSGAVGYYLRDRGMPLDNVSNTVRVFLGTRMECAQCHNHPFDRWTQMDFYKMAAFAHNMTGGNYRSEAETAVSKMIREDKTLDKETHDMMRRAITEAFRPLQNSAVTQAKARMQLPHDYKYPDAKPNQAVQASVPFGKTVELKPNANPIDEFSHWLTSPENPRFTNVIADRLWKELFGVALIEPLDELRDDSVCSNPELMKFLQQQMVALKYDMKAYLRMLLNTQAYQRECVVEDRVAGSPYHFAGPLFRRMTAEQIWDSMVTLVNPSPDEANWSQRERERREMDHRHQLAVLLDATEPQLLFDAANEVADAMKEQNKQFNALRKDLDEARAQGDKAKAQEIQRTLNDSQRLLRETISKCFYDAAKKSGNTEVQKHLADACNGGPMEMAVMNLMGAVNVKLDEMPATPEFTQQLRQEEELLGIKREKDMKSFERYRRGLHQTWCRAAELASPAPRGHFLREFGQSDRDTIQNSSDEASVPQALSIMNSTLVTQLTSGWSALSMNLRRAAQADQKLDTLYLSIFSRKPTPQEKAMLLQMLDASAGSQSAWEDIVLSALSTQQFCFIQ